VASSPCTSPGAALHWHDGGKLVGVLLGELSHYFLFRWVGNRGKPRSGGTNGNCLVEVGWDCIAVVCEFLTSPFGSCQQQSQDVFGPGRAVPSALGTVVLVPAWGWACGGWARGRDRHYAGVEPGIVVVRRWQRCRGLGRGLFLGERQRGVSGRAAGNAVPMDVQPDCGDQWNEHTMISAGTKNETALNVSEATYVANR
jgi:hypothetical protein